MAKRPPRYHLKGERAGFFELVLSFTFHVFERESVISDALKWDGFRLSRCCWQRESDCPMGHWIPVLPQHQSCRVTGVSSFDDKEWCQTPTEPVWGPLSRRPSSACPLCLFAPCSSRQSWLFHEARPWKTSRGKLGRLPSDRLHVWFHFSWLGCEALGAGNHILTDLSTDARLWASLAPAWRQADPCSCTHTNTQTCPWK